MLTFVFNYLSLLTIIIPHVHRKFHVLIHQIIMIFYGKIQNHEFCNVRSEDNIGMKMHTHSNCCSIHTARKLEQIKCCRNSFECKYCFNQRVGWLTLTEFNKSLEVKIGFVLIRTAKFLDTCITNLCQIWRNCVIIDLN
jgi:hypothetical protein